MSWVLGAVLIGTTGAARADQPPGFGSPDEARRILDLPRGTLSLGSTSVGRLEHAAKLPLKGPHHLVLPSMSDRQTNFGTQELVETIQRAAKHVAEAHKRAVLGVGNLGFANGGKIPWSVSHRAGRDADLGMFATDKRGKPLPPQPFTKFGRDLGGGGLKFDLKRNLTLVRFLVEDPEARVQWILCAEWIKTALLAEGHRQKLPEVTVARLEKVLRQPSDSNPHDDHFHLRVYCSIEDRLHGCLNWGPSWEWVDLGDRDYLERVRELLAVLGLAEASLRTQALEKLATIRAESAASEITKSLADPHPGVRQAAWQAIHSLERAEALDGVLAVLAETQDPGWAARLFALLERLPTSRTAEIAAELVANPERYLHPVVAADGLDPFLADVAAVLGRQGQKGAAQPLLELLSRDSAELRKAAYEALRRVTNQDVPACRTGLGQARRHEQCLEAWRAWVAANQAEPWLQWMRIGFERAGYKFTGRMMTTAAIPSLIQAIGNRDRVISQNAVRVLGDLTGYRVDPRWRTPRQNLRHWRNWWNQNRHRYAMK
jgi:penicillin-insensitive murein endopeptidase